MEDCKKTIIHTKQPLSPIFLKNCPLE